MSYSYFWYSNPRYREQCHICGRFIAWDDIQSGKARHAMLTPDSDVSSETWDTLCPKHNTEENRHKSWLER